MKTDETSFAAQLSFAAIYFGKSCDPQSSRGSFWRSWPNLLASMHSSNNTGSGEAGEQTKPWKKQQVAEAGSSPGLKDTQSLDTSGQVQANRCGRCVCSPSSKDMPWTALDQCFWMGSIDYLLICHNVVVSGFRRRSNEMFQKHCTDLNYKICDSCYRGSIMSTFSVCHILQEVCHLVHLELYSV